MTRPTRTVTRNRAPQLPAIDWAPLAWQAAAACAGTSIDLWFRPNSDDDERVRETEGTRHQRERRAKAFCHACPSREPCLTWAFTVDGKGDWFAILGGTTADERRGMRRRKQRRVAT